MRTFITLILLSGLVACDAQTTSEEQNFNLPVQKAAFSDQFKEYWYAGKAELASYELKQARYGEMRDGDAVLIFVTEPFSKEKQVKLDNPQQAGEDKQTVMKLNFTKKFTTGIYPYSMMLSTFTPVDSYNFPNTVKLTMSSQEWCGQVWTQVNLQDDNDYYVQSYSYFESEGDVKKEIETVLLEDEIWNRIRLDYTVLPTGGIKIIPGLFATRLGHKDFKVLNATAEMTKENDQATYTITYPDRTLAITFSTEFPHKILSWEETSEGIGGKTMTTSAKLKETLFIDYWNKNSNADEHLRDSLKLR